MFSVGFAQDFILFGITVPPLYLLWGIGIILMTVFYAMFAKRIGLKWWQGLLCSLSFLIIEVIGAVILANIENFDKPFSPTRFSLFGIMFSLPLGNLLLAKIFKKKYTDIMDYCAPGVLIELTFYRLGCTFAGCCHGFPMAGGLPGQNGLTYFPSQPIEVVFDAALAGLLIWLLVKKKSRPGDVYWLFVLGYCIVRFVLEFTRERNVLFLGMSHSHLLCIGWALVAAYLLIRSNELARRKSRKSKHSH